MKTRDRILVFSAILGLAVPTLLCAQTTEVYSFSPAQLIPDGNASGLSNTHTLNSSIGTITSVTVQLSVTGEFNGDLYGYLRHSSGFTVLLNRPGKTAANAFGYPDSGLNVTFQDNAPNGDIHFYENTTIPIHGSPLTGTWQPDDRDVDPSIVLDTSPRTTALANFNGLGASGDWTLFMADLESGGTNQLTAWGLTIQGGAIPTVTWANPASIIYGTALGASQLNATATFNSTNVPGILVYTNAAGAVLQSGSVLSAGAGQTLFVTFTPTDANTFLPFTTNVALTVTPATVTVASGLAANNKIYDGTTTATISSNTVSLGGVLPGDAANVALSTNGYQAVFASPNVSGGIVVTVTGLTLTGNAANNYTLTQPSYSAAITTKALTVSGITAVSTIYDGTTTAKLGGTAIFQAAEAPGAGNTSDGKPYSVDSVSASGTPSGTLAAKDVGPEAVTITGVTVSGAGNGNYTVTQQTGLTQSVTAKALTVSGITAASTIYDGTTTAKLGGTAIFQGTEAAGSGSTSDGKPYAVDAVSTSGTASGTLAAKDVGTEAVTIIGVTVAGTGNGDYAVTQQTGLTQTITAKALTVSGITAASTIYDGTTTAKLGGMAAFLAAEVAGAGTTSDGKPYTVDAVTTSGTAAGSLASRNVGAEAVTITGVTGTGTGNGNYTVTQQTGLTQTVTAKALTVSGITAASTIYDGTTTAKLGGSAAFQATEAAGTGTTSDGKPYSVDAVSTTETATGTLAAKDVGSEAVTITGVAVAGTGNGNYTATQQTGLTQTVTAKALTVSGITAASTIYDGTTTAKLGGTATFQGTEAAGVGTTGDGKPYSVDAVSTGGTAAGTLASRNVGTEAVTITGVTVTGTGNGDYSVTQQTGLTQTVTAKALTVSGITAASTIYDGTTTAKLSGTAAFQGTEAAGSGTTSDGKPYSVDTVSASGTAAGTLAAKDIGTEAVTITGITVAGTGNGNYSVTQQTGLSQTVTTKALTALGTLAITSRAYTGTTTATPTGSAALQATEGAGAGTTGDGKPYAVDSVSLTGTASYNYNSANVASATTVTESGLSLTGGGSGDYSLVAPTLSATIVQATTAGAITASANPVLPGTTVQFTMTITPVAPGAGTPTGTVNFRTNSVIAASPTLSGAPVSFSTSHLIHGSNAVVAEYAGDPNFIGITNALTPQEVVNTPPVAGTSTIYRTALTSTKVDVATLLANCSDADGDTLTISSVTSPSPNGATITLLGEWVYYTAPVNFTNADTFTYTVSDAYGGTATGTVNVNILSSLAPSLNIAISSLGGGSFLITGSGIPGYTYHVQSTATFSPPMWQNIGTVTADSTGAFQFTTSPGGGAGFFRTAYP